MFNWLNFIVCWTLYLTWKFQVISFISDNSSWEGKAGQFNQVLSWDAGLVRFSLPLVHMGFWLISWTLSFFSQTWMFFLMWLLNLVPTSCRFKTWRRFWRGGRLLCLLQALSLCWNLSSKALQANPMFHSAFLNQVPRAQTMCRDHETMYFMFLNFFLQSYIITTRKASLISLSHGSISVGARIYLYRYSSIWYLCVQV